MNFSDMKDIVITVVASGAFFSFAQFLLTRWDNKKGTEKRLTTKIDEVANDVNRLSDRLEEHKATLARTHILRFADELRSGTHSQEYFQQQLQDIDTYDAYCKAHPEFRNNLTKMSSEFIRDEYRKHYLNNGTD